MGGELAPRKAQGWVGSSGAPVGSRAQRQLLGSCSAPEAKMQGGERSSRSGNIVLLLRPINPSVRGLSLWGCF